MIFKDRKAKTSINNQTNTPLAAAFAFQLQK